MNEHLCAAPGCKRMVDVERLMCVGHWKDLPQDIRDEVWSTWRRIHRDRQAYVDARERAVGWHRDRAQAAEAANPQGSLL